MMGDRVFGRAFGLVRFSPFLGFAGKYPSILKPRGPVIVSDEGDSTVTFNEVHFPNPGLLLSFLLFYGSH